MENDEQNESSKLSGDFFAVDARRWKEACADGMNSAVSYLILCRGTGGDNRTTSWSVSAIEKYTSIARTRARDAIELHLKRSRVELRRSGRNPKYWIVPFGGDETEPEWIWLPNMIIDGAAREVAPVEILRQSSNVKALQLLVELYASQLLDTEGGIEWRPGRGIRTPYFSEKIVPHGQYSIWAFSSADREEVFKEFQPRQSFDAIDDFWTAWRLLRNLGLVYCVAHLVQDDSPEGEIIHPLPYDTTEGTEIERDLAQAARDAAVSMMAEWRQDHPDFSPDDPLAPVLHHYEKVALIGIYRLRYKPHTRATVKWLEKNAVWVAYADRYREIVSRKNAILPNENMVMQYQGGIKV